MATDPDVVADRQGGVASNGGRRLFLMAGLGLALLVVGAVAYFFADDLIELGSWLTSSRAIHVQGHIRY